MKLFFSVFLLSVFAFANDVCYTTKANLSNASFPSYLCFSSAQLSEQAGTSYLEIKGGNFYLSFLKITELTKTNFSAEGALFDNFSADCGEAEYAVLKINASKSKIIDVRNLSLSIESFYWTDTCHSIPTNTTFELFLVK